MHPNFSSSHRTQQAIHMIHVRTFLALALCPALMASINDAQAQSQPVTATAERAPVPRTATLGSVKSASEQIAQDRERLLNTPVPIHNPSEYAYNMLKALYEKAKGSDAALTRRAFVLAFVAKAKAGDVDAGYYAAAARMAKFGLSGGPDAELESGIGAAMRKGRPEAERDYAVLLRNGIGMAKDADKALALAKKAATSGLPSAYALLGEFYSEGIGTAADPAAATAAWKKAAEGGDIPGTLRYGEAATGAYGMKEDADVGIAQMKKAADAGDDRAQYFLGMSTEIGLYGLAKDLKAGTALVEKAADAGNPIAQTIMGLKYSRGAGVSRDADYANMYFEAAARNGNARAQLNFGVRMINGEGMAANREQGVAWLKKAAAQKNEDAMEQLQELGIK